MLPFLLTNREFDCAVVGEKGPWIGKRRLYTLYALADAVEKGKFPMLIKRVKSICGTSERYMAECRILHRGIIWTVLCDLITGSLYHAGQCLSGNLHLVD